MRTYSQVQENSKKKKLKEKKGTGRNKKLLHIQIHITYGSTYIRLFLLV